MGHRGDRIVHPEQTRQQLFPQHPHQPEKQQPECDVFRRRLRRRRRRLGRRRCRLRRRTFQFDLFAVTTVKEKYINLKASSLHKRLASHFDLLLLRKDER